MKTTHAPATPAAHRGHRAPDRLGPLELAIALVVLSTALALVLVGRSVASRTTNAIRPTVAAGVS
ncbi:MAG: hypothetical protein ACXVWF_08965, partial [Actinomycetota bacterium]